jgi:hypothetical protein
MPSPPPGVVVTSTVMEELQEQLLALEDELNSREGVIVAWEDGFAASERVLGKACMERDAECTQAEAGGTGRRDLQHPHGP